MLGNFIGDYIAVCGLVRFSASVDPVISSLVTSAIVLSIGIMTFYFITEKQIKVKQTDAVEEELSFTQKLNIKRKRMWQLVSADIKYAYIFVSWLTVAFIPQLFSTQLMIWMTTFVESGHF
jgi:hypothetical protein